MSAVRGKPDADPTWRPPLLLTRCGPGAFCRAISAGTLYHPGRQAGGQGMIRVKASNEFNVQNGRVAAGRLRRRNRKAMSEPQGNVSAVEVDIYTESSHGGALVDRIRATRRMHRISEICVACGVAQSHRPASRHDAGDCAGARSQWRGPVHCTAGDRKAWRDRMAHLARSGAVRL